MGVLIWLNKPGTGQIIGLVWNVLAGVHNCFVSLKEWYANNKKGLSEDIKLKRKEMDPLVEQMANFNKGITSFTSRALRVTESQVREVEGMRVHERDIKDEMKRNLQVMQSMYERLLNGFMEAS
ncbi:hypothetical protein LWI28_004047 [Acer negundo]|uniref:Uncharacterized protein n=1 Tax=Acer negundo TaxID=4023 RepID=A0AAD5I5K8_ACENE|nr:hypothetical protein LWI28_004047 [Acer negundo]